MAGEGPSRGLRGNATRATRENVNRRPDSNRHERPQISLERRPAPRAIVPTQNVLPRNRRPAVRRHLFAAMDRIRTVPSRRASSPRPEALRRRSDLLVAVDGIEPSRARVWAAAVPCTDCEHADEERGSGLRDRVRTARIKSPVTELQRPAKRSTTERTRTSADNLRSVVSLPWNGGVTETVYRSVAVEGVEPSVRSRLTNGSRQG